jgi:uncharacterized protein
MSVATSPSQLSLADTPKAQAVSFAAGALFGAGLGVSGMTNACKVVAFLDVTGAWDPTLAFVMAGALAVHVVLARCIRRRSAPLLDTVFHMPKQRALDAPLVVGAALFGVGWGLAGYCPGPVLVSLAGARAPVLVFVAAMIAGMLLQHATRPPSSTRLAIAPVRSQQRQQE